MGEFQRFAQSPGRRNAMSTERAVTSELHDGTAWLGLNGPHKRNAIGDTFLAKLELAMRRPCFSAGLELVEHPTPEQVYHASRAWHVLFAETYQAKQGAQLALNEIGLVRIETALALVVDGYCDSRQTGAFILIDRIDNFTLGGGIADGATAPAQGLDAGGSK
jgi:sulfate adenylyltransferase subunit 1 (EFTu-like GTPase family)